MNPPPRKFNLVDAMLLVGAAALAITIVVPKVREQAYLFRMENEIPKGSPLPRDALLDVGTLVRFAEPVLAIGGLALLGLRMRRPRPPISRVALQPGTTVGVATAAVLMGHLLEFFAHGIFFGGFPSSPIDQTIKGCHSQITMAILTAWLVLGLSQRLSCEKSWIDRAGRFLGLLWFVEYACWWWDAMYHE